MRRRRPSSWTGGCRARTRRHAGGPARQLRRHRARGGGRQHLRNIAPVVREALDDAGVHAGRHRRRRRHARPGAARARCWSGYNAAQGARLRARPAVHRHQPPRRAHLRQLAGRRAGTAVPGALPGRLRRAHRPRVHARSHGQYDASAAPATTPPARPSTRSGGCSACRFPGGPHVARRGRRRRAKHARAAPRLDARHVRLQLQRPEDGGRCHVVARRQYDAGRASPWEFQEAVVDVLAGKTSRLARELGAAEVLVAGGVAANTAPARRARSGAARCPSASRRRNSAPTTPR